MNKSPPDPCSYLREIRVTNNTAESFSDIGMHAFDLVAPLLHAARLRNSARNPGLRPGASPRAARTGLGQLGAEDARAPELSRVDFVRCRLVCKFLGDRRISGISCGS